MLALVFVPLAFLALVAAIWGRETAQGCFSNATTVLALLLVAALVAFAPPLGIGIIVVWTLYVAGEWAIKSAPERRQRARQKAAIAQMRTMAAYLDAPLPTADPTPAPSVAPPLPTLAEAPAWDVGLVRQSALGPAVKVRPRLGLDTNPFGDETDFSATPVRLDGHRSHVVHGRTLGVCLEVSPSEYARDWIEDVAASTSAAVPRAAQPRAAEAKGCTMPKATKPRNKAEAENRQKGSLEPTPVASVPHADAPEAGRASPLRLLRQRAAEARSRGEAKRAADWAEILRISAAYADEHGTAATIEKLRANGATPEQLRGVGEALDARQLERTAEGRSQGS